MLLEAPPKEKCDGKMGVYRLVLIEGMWVLETLRQSARPFTAPKGYRDSRRVPRPGQNGVRM